MERGPLRPTSSWLDARAVGGSTRVTRRRPCSTRVKAAVTRVKAVEADALVMEARHGELESTCEALRLDCEVRCVGSVRPSRSRALLPRSSSPFCAGEYPGPFCRVLNLWVYLRLRAWLGHTGQSLRDERDSLRMQLEDLTREASAALDELKKHHDSNTSLPAAATATASIVRRASQKKKKENTGGPRPPLEERPKAKTLGSEASFSGGSSSATKHTFFSLNCMRLPCGAR